MVKKKIVPIVLTMIIMIILLIGVTYAAVVIGKIPIDLPFMKAEAVEYYPETGLGIAKQWENVVIYEPKERPENITDIIDNTEVEEKTETDMLEQFSLVDTDTLKEYISANEDVLKNGYEKIFIDKVDLNNTPTGIKSIYGDDVLAIDMLNKITIIGINIPYGEGQTAKAKLAVVDNKAQVDFSTVEDLAYWDAMEEHVKREQAILGINSNGYVWHSSGKWATMFGLAKRHGEMIRKADTASEAICFAKDGTMSIGTDINEAWNATEYAPTLIKLGEIVYTAENDPEANIRMAQTAVGQTADGKTLLLVVSGGIYGSGNGATYSDILQIMEKYKATNASMLSGGSRTVMFWNDRVVTNNDGYKDQGVLLPTALVVKPASTVETGNNEESKNSTDKIIENNTEESGENIVNSEQEQSSSDSTDNNNDSDATE